MDPTIIASAPILSDAKMPEKTQPDPIEVLKKDVWVNKVLSVLFTACGIGIAITGQNLISSFEESLNPTAEQIATKRLYHIAPCFERIAHQKSNKLTSAQKVQTPLEVTDFAVENCATRSNLAEMDYMREKTLKLAVASNFFPIFVLAVLFGVGRWNRVKEKELQQALLARSTPPTPTPPALS